MILRSDQSIIRGHGGHYSFPVTSDLSCSRPWLLRDPSALLNTSFGGWPSRQTRITSGSIEEREDVNEKTPKMASVQKGVRTRPAARGIILKHQSKQNEGIVYFLTL